MAELLFLTPQEMTQTTIIGGNVDTDKYQMCILETQVRIIEPLLGSELYDKIVSDLVGAGLSGLYLTLFNDFVKPITKYEASASYIAISPYMLNNGGLFKSQPENTQIVEKKEVDGLSERYSAIAQTYVERFNKWILNNPLQEYKIYQDKVNAMSINVNNGWYLK